MLFSAHVISCRAACQPHTSHPIPSYQIRLNHVTLSHTTYQISYLMSQIPYPIYHVSFIRSHISYHTYQLSCLIPYILEFISHIIHIKSHTLHIIYHISYLMYHIFIYHVCEQADIGLLRESQSRSCFPLAAESDKVLPNAKASRSCLCSGLEPKYTRDTTGW